MPRLRGLAVAAALTGACSPSGPRDVAGESRDVTVGPQADGGAAQSETYVYAARRPHGTIALAEARHMREDESQALVEQLADAFETCATRLEAERALVEGAARIIAVAQPSGPPGIHVSRIAPGGDVAQNALLCIAAPIRSLPFPPPTSTGVPGFALEATWGPRGAPNPAPSP